MQTSNNNHISSRMWLVVNETHMSSTYTVWFLIIPALTLFTVNISKQTRLLRFLCRIWHGEIEQTLHAYSFSSLSDGSCDSEIPFIPAVCPRTKTLQSFCQNLDGGSASVTLRTGGDHCVVTGDCYINQRSASFSWRLPFTTQVMQETRYLFFREGWQMVAGPPFRAVRSAKRPFQDDLFRTKWEACSWDQQKWDLNIFGRHLPIPKLFMHETVYPVCASLLCLLWHLSDFLQRHASW